MNINNSALAKLSYEIKNRKKEFLTICAYNDKQLLNKIPLQQMKDILNKFSCYLSDDEKNEVIRRFAVNNEHINYINMSNINVQNLIEYEDDFLKHLNRFNDREEFRYSHLNIRRISQILNIAPLELLDYQMCEENFIKKICKQINEKCHNVNEIFMTCDFDHDNHFTIGELKMFFEILGINIYDSDMVFFFDAMKPTAGRVAKENIISFIQNMANKRYSKLELNSHINNLIKEEEVKEKEIIENIIINNQFIKIINESLICLGKNSFMKYLSSYLITNNNNLFVDINNLEKCLQQLGYGIISKNEKNNFKYYCVKKNYMDYNSGLIDIEELIQHISDYFGLNKDEKLKDSNVIINDMNKVFFEEISKLILKSVFPFDKYGNDYPNRLNEIDFRKNFFKKFSFIDHSFLDYFIEYSKNIGLVHANQWISFSFNIIFMGFIKYYDQLGLMLDIDDRIILKDIYNKIESKAFPRNLQVKGKVIKLSNKEKMIIKDEGEKIDLKVEKQDIKLLTISRSNPIKNNKIKEVKRIYNPNDIINHIPRLYDYCTKHILDKFKIDSINSSILTNIGICDVFREHFNIRKININNDIDHDLFILEMEDILPEDIYNFILHYSSKYKDTNNYINVKYFFFQLEEILLQHSKLIN